MSKTQDSNAAAPINEPAGVDQPSHDDGTRNRETEMSTPAAPADDLELPEEPKGAYAQGYTGPWREYANALLSLARKMKERLAKLARVYEHYQFELNRANEAERKLAEAERREGKK